MVSLCSLKSRLPHDYAWATTTVVAVYSMDRRIDNFPLTDVCIANNISYAVELIAQEVCSNRIPGVETGSVCCVAECGTCGGTGCRDRATVVGLTADDCCSQCISDSSVYCEDSGTAPCIIGK